MYIFLLAGCEVVLSAFVLAIGNFLCISKKSENLESKAEMAVMAAETQELKRAVEPETDREEEIKEGGNGKVGEEVAVVKEMGEDGTVPNTETSL